MSNRKQIGLKLPVRLIEHIDRYCAQNELTRTAFIESLVRRELPPLPIIDSGRRFDGNIEDMPLEI